MYIAYTFNVYAYISQQYMHIYLNTKYYIIYRNKVLPKILPSVLPSFFNPARKSCQMAFGRTFWQDWQENQDTSSPWLTLSPVGYPRECRKNMYKGGTSCAQIKTISHSWQLFGGVLRPKLMTELEGLLLPLNPHSCETFQQTLA